MIKPDDETRRMVMVLLEKSPKDIPDAELLGIVRESSMLSQVIYDLHLNALKDCRAEFEARRRAREFAEMPIEEVRNLLAEAEEEKQRLESALTGRMEKPSQFMEQLERRAVLDSRCAPVDTGERLERLRKEIGFLRSVLQKRGERAAS